MVKVALYATGTITTKHLPMIKIARILWVILTLLFFSVVSLFGQCTTAITVESLPYSDTFCTTPEIETQVVESNECYDCINNAGWYHFEVAEGGGLINLEVAFDLCNSNGSNCGNVNGYYWLFDGCPEEGGALLSVPSLDCWGEVMYSCWWPWYPFNTLTCFSGIPETSAGTEFNYPPSTHYQIEFELEQGDYYFAVAPSGTCSAVAYGCIELEFSGPNILEIVQESEPFTESEQDMNGVYYTEGIGVYILRDGKKYNLLGQEIN